MMNLLLLKIGGGNDSYAKRGGEIIIYIYKLI